MSTPRRRHKTPKTRLAADDFRGPLGDAVREARIGAGLSQNGLAVAAGVNITTIQRVELGVGEIKARTLRLIERATATPPGGLFARAFAGRPLRDDSAPPLREVAPALAAVRERGESLLAFIDGGDGETTKAPDRPWLSRSRVDAVACDMMAGFALLGLQRKHGFPRGMHRRACPITRYLRLIWPKTVRRAFGVSTETARRWMKLAQLTKPRLVVLFPEVAAVLSRSPDRWSGAESDAVFAVVKTFCAGKSRRAILWLETVFPSPL